jgi:hypothetical protein
MVAVIIFFKIVLNKTIAYPCSCRKNLPYYEALIFCLDNKKCLFYFSSQNYNFAVCASHHRLDKVRFNTAHIYKVCCMHLMLYIIPYYQSLVNRYFIFFLFFRSGDLSIVERLATLCLIILVLYHKIIYLSTTFFLI